MSEYRYPIAPNGIFWTIQGEGALLGVPMVFVRLGGCNVGCPECDTDYSVKERLTAKQIVARATALSPAKWVWITGGEPTVHPLEKLLLALGFAGYSHALATAGENEYDPNGWRVCEGYAGTCFLSVSPHRLDTKWKVRCGSQLNVVPGLNGLRLADLEGVEVSRFGTRYITPCDGKPETLAECVEWVKAHHGWRLGVQAHKVWRLP